MSNPSINNVPQTSNRSTKTRFNETARHCLSGTRDVCCRSWMWVTRTTVSAWNWLYDNVFNSPCCIVDEGVIVSRSKRDKIKGNVKQNRPSSPPTKLLKYLPPQKRVVNASPQKAPSFNTSTMSSSPLQSPSPSPPQKYSATSSASTIDSDQQVTQNVKQSSVPADQQRLASVAAPNQERRPDDKTKPPKVAPPKIDFVETGSIFGDRKRHAPQPMLLDNGRFKSPGEPNVTQGPGGRSIRISFQTGLVSIKSIESRAPVIDKFDSREVPEAEPTADNAADADNLDQISKIKQNRKRKRARTKRKIAKTLRSYKSNASRDSKDSQDKDHGATFDEPTTRTTDEGEDNIRAEIDQ